MFTFLDKKKIEEIEEEIIRDYSAKTETAYILPFKFTKPKKVKGSIYRVKMETVNFDGISYPVDVFATMEFVGNDLVYLLRYEYESLGQPYKLSDGSILCGIKGDFDSSDVKMISFDIDVKKGTYSLADEIESEKVPQPGNV